MRATFFLLVPLITGLFATALHAESMREIDYFSDRDSVLDVLRPDQKELPPFQSTKASEEILSNLRTYLDSIHYDEAIQKIFGNRYKGTTIFDSDELKGNFEALKGTFTQNQQDAIRFFFFGQHKPARFLNDDKGKELLKGLEQIGLVQTGAGKLEFTNSLSLASYKLANGQTMYLFSDLPPEINDPTDRESRAILKLMARKPATAEISTTSNVLLARIEQDYESHKQISGIVADFGSGVGIQSIALLKLHPKIQKAIGLEIDEHEMTISRINAALNGVSNRFVAVQNMDTTNLAKELHGEKLSFAVSNPPFNLVPNKLEKEFDAFGFGGDDGLEITRIFLKQAAENLSPTGEFLFYSQLGSDDQGKFLVEKDVQKTQPTGAKVNVEEGFLANYTFRSTELYGERMALYFADKKPEVLKKYTQDEVSRMTREALDGKGIATVRPAFVYIHKDPQLANSPTSIVHEKHTLPLYVDRVGEDLLRGIEFRSEMKHPIGGITERLEGFQKRLGGVTKRMRLVNPGGVTTREELAPGGVYLQIRELPLLHSTSRPTTNCAPTTQPTTKAFGEIEQHLQP